MEKAKTNPNGHMQAKLHGEYVAAIALAYGLDINRSLQMAGLPRWATDDIEGLTLERLFLL